YLCYLSDQPRRLRYGILPLLDQEKRDFAVRRIALLGLIHGGDRREFRGADFADPMTGSCKMSPQRGPAATARLDEVDEVLHCGLRLGRPGGHHPPAPPHPTPPP